MKYFYLNLIGQLVHVHTVDRAIIEGLFVSRIDPSQYPAERLQHSKDQIGGVILRYYRYCQSSLHGVEDPAKLNENDLLICYDQMIYMEAASLKLRTETPGSGQVQGFRGGRDLEKLDWAGKDELLEGGDGSETSPRGTQGVGGWDQFKTNERKFGVKSTYKEEHYTTKLDKTEFTTDQIKQAEAVAQEIEKTLPTHGVAHALDRQEVLQEDMDEGQLYSDVLRSGEAGGRTFSPPASHNAASQSPPVGTGGSGSTAAVRGKGGKNNTSNAAVLTPSAGNTRNTVPAHAGGPAPMGKGSTGAMGTAGGAPGPAPLAATAAVPTGAVAAPSSPPSGTAMPGTARVDPTGMAGAGSNASIRSLDVATGGGAGDSGAHLVATNGSHADPMRAIASSADFNITAPPFHPPCMTCDDFLEAVGNALMENARNCEALPCWPGDEVLINAERYSAGVEDPNSGGIPGAGGWMGGEMEESNASHGGGMMMHGGGGALGSGGMGMGGMGGSLPPGGHSFYSNVNMGTGPGMGHPSMGMKGGGPGGHGGNGIPMGGPGGMGTMYPMGAGMGGSGPGGLLPPFHEPMGGMGGGGHLLPHSHHAGGGSNTGGYNSNNGGGGTNANNNSMLGNTHGHYLPNGGNNNNNNSFHGGGGSGANPNAMPHSRHGMPGPPMSHGTHSSALAPPPGMPPNTFSMLGMPAYGSPPSSNHSGLSSSPPMAGGGGHPSSMPVGTHLPSHANNSTSTGTANTNSTNGTTGSSGSGGSSNQGVGSGGSGSVMFSSGGMKSSPAPPQSHLLQAGSNNANMPPSQMYSGGVSTAAGRSAGGYMSGSGSGYIDAPQPLYGSSVNSGNSNSVPPPGMGGPTDAAGNPLNVINTTGHMFQSNTNSNTSTNANMMMPGSTGAVHHPPAPPSLPPSAKGGSGHPPPSGSSSSHPPSLPMGGASPSGNTSAAILSTGNNSSNSTSSNMTGGGRAGASRPPKSAQQQPQQPVAVSSSSAVGGTGGNPPPLPNGPHHHHLPIHSHNPSHHPDQNTGSTSLSPTPPPGVVNGNGVGGGGVLANVESGTNSSGNTMQEKHTHSLPPGATASTGTSAGTRKLRRGGRDDKRGSK